MRKVRREGPHSCIPHFLCHLENNTPVLSVALHSIIVRFTSHAASLWCSPSVQIPPPPPAHHRLIWPLKRSRQKKEKKKPHKQKNPAPLFVLAPSISLSLFRSLSVSPYPPPPSLPLPSPPPCPHLRVLRPQAFHGKVSQWLIHNVISLFSRLPLPRLHRAQWRDMMMMEGGEGG